MLKRNAPLRRALQKAILLQVYDTDAIFAKLSQDARFPELKIGLPFFVILRPNGKLQWKTTNYQDTSGMIQAIQTITKAK